MSVLMSSDPLEYMLCVSIDRIRRLLNIIVITYNKYDFNTLINHFFHIIIIYHIKDMCYS